MKLFVTGVTGQLGHDVVIEAVKRGHTVIGSGSRAIPASKEKMRGSGDDMKIFVTGVGGQLGHDVVNEMTARGHEAVGSDIQASYSGVDDHSAVVTAPYVQLDITDEKAVDAKMLYLSTDYVFDGRGTRPWQPDDKNYSPLNYYGETKLEGERAVAEKLDKFFIVRIAWVFGLNGKNFIKTMINVGKTHDTVRVVNDQIGTPTYTKDLARLLVDMVETEKYGYYHATNEGGYISWYDFCCEFYRQYGLKTKVIPVTTAEYGLSKAARPENSRLDKSKLISVGFQPLPTWQDAVSRYLQEAQL